MKFRKKLFANIGYTGKMIVLMWQNDKMYLFYMLLDIIAYSSPVSYTHLTLPTKA